ncbi:MAG: hypothetical protein PPP56_00970 [Longimonas sp.]|uniref:hypothetical protein n=1 Tax=Longimonas sp. TaxID=2039626 RepID=UPI00335DA6E8
MRDDIQDFNLVPIVAENNTQGTACSHYIQIFLVAAQLSHLTVDVFVFREPLQKGKLPLDSLSVDRKK